MPVISPGPTYTSLLYTGSSLANLNSTDYTAVQIPIIGWDNYGYDVNLHPIGVRKAINVTLEFALLNITDIVTATHIGIIVCSDWEDGGNIRGFPLASYSYVPITSMLTNVYSLSTTVLDLGENKSVFIAMKLNAGTAKVNIVQLNYSPLS